MNRRLSGANEADDPFWIDEGWLDTVVTVGLTCFILCLLNLSKVLQLYIFYRQRLRCAQW